MSTRPQTCRCPTCESELWIEFLVGRFRQQPAKLTAPTGCLFHGYEIALRRVNSTLPPEGLLLAAEQFSKWFQEQINEIPSRGT